MANDFLHPANCACFNTRRAARKITQLYDQALRPAGLQATQFTLLAVLAHSSETDGIPMTTLAKRLGMDRTTLTRNLRLVEREQWAQTIPGEDRRERLINLTDAGRQKVKEAMPYWKGAQKKTLKLLGEEGLSDFLSLSQRLDPQ